jgi:tRNA threonylcarbamoyladenosine biosynthesis protein TsaB
MITLGIDTSTTRGSVALLQDNKPLGTLDFDRLLTSSSSSHTPLTAIASLLESHRKKVCDLDLISVGVGPGSFTGIRAGIAAAKGLSLPHSIPVVPVCSFDALALTTLPSIPLDCPSLCVICDARRGEVYHASYDRTGLRSQDCRLGTLESLADEIHDPIWFVSSEILLYSDLLRQLFGGFASISKTPSYPSAKAVAMLGNRGVTASSLEPIYLRTPDYKRSG